MRSLVVVAVVACSQPRDDGAVASGRTATARAPDTADARGADPRAEAADAPPIDDAAVATRPITVATRRATVATRRAAIVDAPMKWSNERLALTLAYRRTHSDPAATDLVITPRVIVLHYTAGNSAKGTREYMDNLRIEASRKELVRGGPVNVSSHFLVDRDGTIYRLQPETRFARHCIGLNHIAIGIENVGDDKRWPLTDAQVEANAALVRDLAARFPITHLLGHSEAMQFRDHPYYVERDQGYRNDKPDPGASFLRRVRERVADLKLSGL